jgi:1-deoxy-D-xylulose-5-phosphate synthase
MAILAFGTLLNQCIASSESLDLTLVDMRFVKPLDEELLKELALTHRGFVTVEDGVVAGGAGSAVQEFFNAQN